MPTRTYVRCTVVPSWQSSSKSPQMIYRPPLSRKINVRFLSSLIWVWELHILCQLLTSYPNLWVSRRWHDPLCGEKPKLSHADKSLVTSDVLKLFFRSVSPANNQEGVLERSAGGAAVVHQGSVFGCLCGWYAWVVPTEWMSVEWIKEFEVTAGASVRMTGQKECSHLIFWLHTEGHDLQDILCILVRLLHYYQSEEFCFFFSEIAWNSEGSQPHSYKA